MTIPPIPAKALPVVDAIRREVPRPKELPKPTGKGIACLGWKAKRFDHDGDLCCPLGLLPKASDPRPETLYGMVGPQPFCTNDMAEFYNWWDVIEEKDARAAVDAVWGPEPEGAP